jgi:hypothetical protein
VRCALENHGWRHPGQGGGTHEDWDDASLDLLRTHLLEGSSLEQWGALTTIGHMRPLGLRARFQAAVAGCMENTDPEVQRAAAAIRWEDYGQGPRPSTYR